MDQPDHDAFTCSYAHSLSELRAPDERLVRDDAVWLQYRVDRFYGQFLHPDQVHRIKYHYYLSHL